MPKYEYLCEKCGYKLEEYRTMGKRNWYTKCNKCGNQMIRLIGSNNPVNLKGDGYYKKGWQ